MTTPGVTCWNGTPSAFETQLMAVQPNYALEQLRQRLMYAVVSPYDPTKAARVVFQMAYETELAAILAKMITLPASVPTTVSTVCERQSFTDADASMQLYSFLVSPALTALGNLPNIPAPYVDLLARYATSEYPRYRTCALAAILCLATFLENN
jgi:hypothetical protein